MDNPKPKRKGRSITVSVNEENTEAFLQAALEITAGREGSFAGEVLNLMIECLVATGLHWDDYKRQLPGYEAAMKARRLRAAGEHWQASGELDAAVKRVQQLPADKVQEAARLLDQLAAREKTKPKPKAS